MDQLPRPRGAVWGHFAVATAGESSPNDFGSNNGDGNGYGSDSEIPQLQTSTRALATPSPLSVRDPTLRLNAYTDISPLPVSNTVLALPRRTIRWADEIGAAPIYTSRPAAPAGPPSPPAQRRLYLWRANSVPLNIAPPGYSAETLPIYVAPIDSTPTKRRRDRVRKFWSGFVSRIRNQDKGKPPGGQGPGGGSQGGAIIQMSYTESWSDL